MRLRILAILLASMAGPCCIAQMNSAATASPVADGQHSTYVPVHEFDSKRDADADILAAIAEARRTGKRILLYVGGSWCPYCSQMGELFQKNPDLIQLREASYVTVYIYYGYGNYNKQALSAYGNVPGIPHFFVLESDGTLLHSQHVIDLRANGDYSPEKMKDFLLQWATAAEASRMPVAQARR